ncbi:MAG: two-component system VirA-like sensor kinase [Inquilinus limosus]|uniref:histidine kinase n=1 Tax=Inquilinus limosus TaxID=171674 RepID=A0A952FFP4_9PROT|nr:two-component system VirA-like sensor kinase [Inquilinus limosus]
MRITPTLAAVPLLLLLLTWLLVRGINPEAETFDRALGTLDDALRIENALRRDILASRAGLLRNYDPLVRDSAGLRDLMGRLDEVAALDPRIAASVGDLSALMVRQDELIEDFKSKNALLQNSLAYFGVLGSRLGATDGDGALAADVGALAAAMLRLTLDTSPTIARDVQDRLEALGGRPPPPGDAAPLRALLAHGRLLHDLLPATDGVLKTLFALPTGREQAAIRGIVLDHQMASREEARKFRILLYGVSVALLGLLIHAGLQLRAGALSLRRRAAFEHLIAGISARLITARRPRVGAQIERALADLASHVGADRAYVLFGGPARRLHVWSRAGAACPPGWPDRAAALSAGFDRTLDGLIHVRHVARLPAGPARDALAAAGLDGWACVASRGSDGATDIMGFDALPPSRMIGPDQLSLLRTAFDAIANAVGRDQLEHERSRLEERLQQARRMETVGALASGIAHNFNNIVGAILGYTEMAEAEIGPDGRAGRHLRGIRGAGERARDLIGQILAYGRRRAAPRRPVEVQALVAEAASLLRASLPPGVELVLEQEDGAAMVAGEAAQIQQVVLNLCNNAAQAMDGAGRVGIEVERHDVVQAQGLSHGSLAPGRYVRIAVSDAGRGIDAETLSRIFEPFFTMRQDGNGLGLATVREIVQEHGGAIDVWSRPGQGSRFAAWLPCIIEAEPPEAPVVASMLGHGEAVLLIDGDRKLLLRDEEMLAALGYEPIGFTSGADAQAACRASPDRFDVLIISHGSSAQEALDLAAALHEAAPGLPILLALPSSERIDADALAVAGVFGVVRRPLSSTNVAAVLGNARSRNRELADASA